MKFSKSVTVLTDLITISLCYTPACFAIYLSLLSLEFSNYKIVQAFAAPFLLQIYFIVIIFLIRILLPTLKPGVYKTGFNLGFLAWYTHSMLTRSARCFGLHYLIHSTGLMRWLYWRALGAKAPYNMNTSYKVTLHDAPVISIGAGTILSEDAELSGHLVRGDKVLVAPVKIGTGVFIGRGTYVGPRTRIGNSAWIGMNNTLAGQVIKENQVVKSQDLAAAKNSQ
jgi:hypothetical protein